MAQYEHLPLFKNAYEFKLYFVKLSRGFPKDFKYGLAVEVRKLCLEIIDNIILANNSVDKGEYIQKIVLAVERIKIKIRLLNDLEVINLKSYRFSFESLIEISKQASAWKKWSGKAH